MPPLDDTAYLLAAIPNLQVVTEARLGAYTRFGLGGLAAVLAETTDEAAFVRALSLVAKNGEPFTVIGAGSNLIVADQGYAGVILKFSGHAMQFAGNRVTVQAGAVLQDLVDAATAAGLKGLETMTGIPGFTGGAVYGNAGAYGHSIAEIVQQVQYFDAFNAGSVLRCLTNPECQFQYRESIFKQRKGWVILSATLVLEPADPLALQKTAAGILAIRNEKYPPTMRCAGSIFKNLLVRNLPLPLVESIPPGVVREGKVPSAYFLERVGAKGMRQGDIQVAEYHANLIYNDGQGTATDLRALIGDLKRRVHDQFGITLEEEVQYVGFGDPSTSV